MRRPEEIRKLIWDYCRPKSLVDTLGLVGAAVTTAWFVYTIDFGPWKPIMPLLAVALFAYLLWAIILIRRTLYPETVPTDPSPARKTIVAPSVAVSEREPFVEFTLPGSWAELGFRHRSLGRDGQHELLAEEVYLRIRALQNMQNVHVKIAARHTRPHALEPVAEIESGEWVGVVTKGREQSFQILQRTYWDLPASYTDPTTEQQVVRSLRVEKQAFFFPENPRRFAGSLNHLYFFRVTVHHEKGPDEAEFAIELKERRQGPQSLFKALRNIQPVGN